MTTRTLLACSGVAKSYSGNVALHPTDFELSSGECVGIIGENGAGKSTFAKIVTGAVTPDAGTIVTNGREAWFKSPRDALAEGIVLIPQELAYVPELSVAENIMINRLPTRRGFTSKRMIERAAREAMDQTGLHVDPTERMAGLRVADQQIVEIVKALVRGSRVLVLDEPTAALTEEESVQLFKILSEQQTRGIGLILISHRLEEVRRQADRVDVFRNGRKTFVASPRDTPIATFIGHMLGTSMEEATVARDEPVAGDPLLRLDDWEADGLPGLRGLSLEVREREILGVYSIRGSGSELVAEGMAGGRPDIRGTVTIGGRSRRVFRSPRQAIDAGVACVPQDRKRSGLVLSLSVRRSIALMVLRRLASAGFVQRAREGSLADSWIKRFQIRCASPEQPVGELSGGNQQKVLLAGRLATEPRVLVVHEPTRGVDVGARREIHETLRTLSDSGTGVLLITSDVEEAATTSDRLIVIRDGQVVAELTGADITQDRAAEIATM